MSHLINTELKKKKILGCVNDFLFPVILFWKTYQLVRGTGVGSAVDQ